jgi:predicted O-methyltransferase YrrM
VDEHSLHSPFFFELYTKTIKGRTTDSQSIEQLRQKLLSDNRRIEVTDFGSGSSYSGGWKRRICRIAGTSLSPKKYTQLYQRIIDRFHCENILELGTSLGINTLYLASHATSSVTTFEGSPAIAEIAKALFVAAEANNITIVTGDIDHTLPEHLAVVEKIDFAFMDANHRYTPTLNYFDKLLQKVHEQSVVVLDDIHYSLEMENAWTDIRHHPRVYATADLFRCGLVFFDPSLNRQHHVLQF